jgi:hypothetical protein
MKSKVLRIGLIILLLIGALFSYKIWYSFFARSRLYDVRYNAEREKRGILPLPADWITYDKTRDTKTWFPPPHDTTAGVFRSMKLVVVEDGEIKSELDHIAKRVKGSYEFVLIESFYDSADSKMFVYDGPESSPDTILKWQADSILQSWNFKY